jgi:hypothetical protein
MPSIGNEHPISTTYLDVQTARVSAALPAAGAWDATPLILPCAGFRRMTLAVSYTRGGAAGAVDIQVLYSLYSANPPVVQAWHNQSLYAPAAVAGGADSASRFQRETVTYQSVGAGIENVPFGTIELDGTVERIQVRARESGNVGAPGTLHIVASFS